MFENARIKLTLWYLIIIMAVSGFFSLIVFRGFTKELGRGFRMQMHGTGPRVLIPGSSGYSRILPFVIYPEEFPPEEVFDIVSIAKKRFAIQLIIINGGILILAGTLGYILAGKTLRPIEEMVDEQKRFVANASHELRTPLTSIKTEVEVALRDKSLTLKEAKSLLNSNLNEVDRMKYFSDNLLTLSRYESNGRDLALEEVDLSEVIMLAIERNKPQADSKNIKIKKDLSEVVVYGNPQSLVELISILINNAIKYSEKGKSLPAGKAGVTVSLKRQKKNAVITVRDEGMGIAKKDIPHVFDRFYRVDSSRSKHGVDGYGLGLSIARSIVDAHKGEIKVQSSPGKGSIFKVTIPS